MTEQFYEWLIDTVPAARINRELDEWKRARAEGWDITVLLKPTGGDVVVLGIRPLTEQTRMRVA